MGRGQSHSRAVSVSLGYCQPVESNTTGLDPVDIFDIWFVTLQFVVWLNGSLYADRQVLKKKKKLRAITAVATWI